MEVDHASYLEGALPWQGMLGYVNFSAGKPDLRFQQQLNEAYRVLAERGFSQPWKVLHDFLRARLAAVKAAGSEAFRDAQQAETVLDLVFDKALPAYRQHHADLLSHLSDQDLFQPFFLARVFEAVLSQGPPWREEQRILTAALAQLNDFVGHRPVAILETRPRGEPYPHERVRPIPLSIRGAGVGAGRYHDLVAGAMDILANSDPAILADASFDLKLLDELALDPRAYDQGHPVNRRPNYIFGEWDPHHLDNHGYYRRFVVRQVVLDALLHRAEQPRGQAETEALVEAATVLAGTILMASGISGASPTAHDSSQTLATLMPRVARVREAFYSHRLGQLTGPFGDRLRQEAAVTRQPFGRTRQQLNHFLARHRAEQFQQRHLALVFAEIGYPEASRQAAAKIPTASLRLQSEIWIRITTGQRLAETGQLPTAASLLAEAEDLLRRGIACGALADPWNILGFQGLFPLSAAQEDSVRDTRIDELLQLVDHLFDLYARLLSEAGAAGDRKRIASLVAGLRRLAAGWDRFASSEVSAVQRVHGGEALASAEHVATAMSHWHDRGEATGDLAFWRQHLEGFRSPKAFVLVIDALLTKHDERAAMALLMTWLGQVEQVPLEDGAYSFHALALRWMLDLTSRQNPADSWPLVQKFFDFLEANAEDYWQVPELGPEELPAPRREADEEDEVFGAAYEGVTYRDSADDDQEGAVLDGGPPRRDFDLEEEGEALGKRLRFLSTVARLWQIACRGNQDQKPTLRAWLATAQARQQRLLVLLDSLHAYPVPEPLGSQDSLVEYDRRRAIKDQLLAAALGTCFDFTLAVGALRGAVSPDGAEDGAGPPWERWAIRLEQALMRGDRHEARALLPDFVERFQGEPLVFQSLEDGGHPRDILRVRLSQNTLRALVSNLPRLGLLRETFHLLKTARAMEDTHPAQGRGVTLFNHLFQAGFQAVVECLIDSVPTWEAPASGSPFPITSMLPSNEHRTLIGQLHALATPFLMLWIEHAGTLRLSVLETTGGPDGWQALQEFVKRYGADLFQVRFMTLANLRGILRRGVGSFLDNLSDNPDPLHPVKLIEDLDGPIRRSDAVRFLGTVLQAVVENYEEYKDYNTTTMHSDYGQNLYLLLDFVKLKARYDRHAWHVRPLEMAHEVLARNSRPEAGLLWQQAIVQSTQEAANLLLEELDRLEREHGMRLRTVRDRLEERLVKPLAVDRMCALIEPAMNEAVGPGEKVAFARLQAELATHTATPSGTGQDVPVWLRRLEEEIQRVRASRSAIAELIEEHFRVPKQPLAFEDLQRQLEDWNKPLKGS